MIDIKAKLASLEGTHDLKSLPLWGPYTKRYMGISHIPELGKGFRFDFSIAPGFHRRSIEIPNVMWDTGFMPLAASPDLRYYAHRHRVSGDGKVFCDIEFFNLDASSSAFRCRLVNGHHQAESLSLNLFACMNFPQLRDYSLEETVPARRLLPEGATWTPALRYAKIEFAKPFKTENLSPDGRPHGQLRANGFCDGEGFQFVPERQGDKLTYFIVLQKPCENAILALRAKTDNNDAVLEVSGAFSGRLAIQKGELSIACLKAEGKLSGEIELSIRKISGGAIQIDGFAILPSDEADALRFENAPWEHTPETSRPSSNSIILKYRAVEPSYGFAWDAKGCSVLMRQHFCEDLDCGARKCLNNIISTEIHGQGNGHYENAVISPVFVEGGASFELNGIVCRGTENEVERLLKNFAVSSEKLDALKAAAFKNDCSPAGRKYASSQNMMAALTLSQVVYPVSVAGTVIRHSPPGRWWDCLYTWDSGFIGLGLSSLDLERAVWNLNAYMNQGESYAAFVHHGTPMPMQPYLYLELWSKTQSLEFLEHFFKPLEKYYLFLAGRLPGSTTRNLKSQLIRTWDYCYNSGGWDDYPAQVATHNLKLEDSVTPAVATAQLIRFAKILRMAALKLNKSTSVYDEDIAVWSDALNKHSWDDEAKYYSYVLHDAAGIPSGILRHDSGSNFNMGMDGAAPLVAGICDETQEKELVAHLMSKGRLWTSCGISTVDLRAPYYSDSGYWNGAVWLPHQWLFWKAMLDLGRASEAFKIAKTALALWQREATRSNAAFEHFNIKSGRGAGWHQFTGLSCPVLNWFAAYFRPGNFTAGFDAFIEKAEFSKDKRAFSGEITLHSIRKGHCSCLAAMAPEARYKVEVDGENAKFKERLPGVLEIELPLSGLEKTMKVKIEG